MRKGLLAVLLSALVAVLLVAAVACGNGKEDTPETADYTVTYAAGADDATGTAPAAKSYQEGDTVILAPADTFLREGYMFDTWRDGSETYAAGASYTMPARNVTFTAQWKSTEPEIDDPSDEEMERVTAIPAGSLTTQSGSSTANWFAHYGEDSLTVTAWVADTQPYSAGKIHENDGIEVTLSRVARERGYTEKTITVLADLAGNVRVTLAATGDVLEDSQIHSAVKLVTLDGKTAAGYCIEVSVPYAEVEFTSAEKNAALVLVYRSRSEQGVVSAITNTAFGTDPARVHTYIALTGDDTFEQNPYFQYGAVWGDGGVLRASDVWDLERDTDMNGSIRMHGEDNADNYVYMHGSDTASRKVYAEMEINVMRALKLNTGRYDEYPKFGIVLSNADGSKRFFYFVDARADAFSGDIQPNAVSLGTTVWTDGGWDWSRETTAGELGGTSAAYYPSGYVKLGVYREGNTVSLYANGVKMKTMQLDFGADESVYIGLASFHLELSVRNYRLETENFDGYNVEAQELDYLFLGASTLTASSSYWYSYDAQFSGEKAANLSVPGYQVENWVNQLDSLHAMYKPQNIIMHIGMNNINNAGESGQTVIGRLEELFGGLKERYPDAQLYYISITRNVEYSKNDAHYNTVNSWVRDNASNTYGVHFIDVDSKFDRPNGQASMQWFVSDGYHLSSDGYGIYHREIVKALGIEYKASVSGLGDTLVEGAPDYGHTGDWQVEGDIWHGNYGRESRLMINGAYGSTVYAEAKVSIVDVNGSYEKAGIAVSSASGTYFFYINLALELSGNSNREWRDNYGAVCYRAETHYDKNWIYPEAPGLYRPFGGNGYVHLGDEAYDWKSNHDAYKTLGVAKIGTTLYFFASGNIVGTIPNAFGANENVTVSVFAFNTDMYAKGGFSTTDEAAVRAKVPAASTVSVSTPANEALPSKKD